MSQSSNHVKWCLNKAKKEIEECRKLGKREKHRGLLQIDPDMELARYHLEKAQHNLRAAISLKEGGFSDWSISATFYTIYHCFLSIAAKFGYESGNQSCTIALIEHLKESGKIYIDDKYVNLLKYTDTEDSVIDLREEYTYGIKISVDNLQIEELINDCKAMIDITKEIIY